MDDKVFKEFSTEAPLNAEPIQGRRYLAGLDWGQVGGHAAIVVVDAAESRIVEINRFQEYGWTSRRQHVLETYERWRLITILATRDNAGADIEDLQSMGIPVRTVIMTNRFKTSFIESFAHALRRREIQIPPHEALLQQLNHFRVIPLKNDNYRLSVDMGLTEELVIASALALHAIRHAGLPIDFV